ncbi:hypothetical protein B0H14DRAFT_3497603 [Mycena olivaceomarginata]|nr:hypothetical protein B0H14DRAFT_3497603 [Mycena olivaceomarginata]
MTPALELPFELISRIFILMSPTSSTGPISPKPDACDGIPMLFGQSPAEPLEDHTAALIDLWFTRAAGYPLSISLICAKNHFLPGQLLTILAEHFSHWARIELRIPMADFLVFNEAVGPFPSLESVTIQITDRFNSFSRVRLHLVQNSPHLKALRLMDHAFVPTPFNDLGDIPPTFIDHCAALSDLPYLVCLGISFNHMRTLPLHGFGLQPSFETLLLDDESLLIYFTIPMLTSLGVWPRGSAAVVAFLSRSQRRLTTLTLGLYEDKLTTTVVGCLSVLPELYTLQLILADEMRRPGSFDGGLWCQVLRHAELVPQLCSLISSSKACIPPYAEWVALLETRQAVLVHAELHMRHRHARRMPASKRTLYH